MKVIKIQSPIYNNGQTDGMSKWLVSNKDGSAYTYAANSKDAKMKVKAGFIL